MTARVDAANLGPTGLGRWFPPGPMDLRNSKKQIIIKKILDQPGLTRGQKLPSSTSIHNLQYIMQCFQFIHISNHWIQSEQICVDTSNLGRVAAEGLSHPRKSSFLEPPKLPPFLLSPARPKPTFPSDRFGFAPVTSDLSKVQL